MRLVGPIAPATKRGRVRRLRRPLVGGFAGEARRLDVQLVGERLEPVVGLRDRGAAERVGLDDVGAGLEIGVVDGGDDVGAREDQQVDVALEQRAGGRGSASPRNRRLVQLVPLDHRAHRAVEQQDACRRARGRASGVEWRHACQDLAVRTRVEAVRDRVAPDARAWCRWQSAR